MIKKFIAIIACMVLVFCMTSCASESTTLSSIKSGYNVQTLWSHQVGIGSGRYKLQPSYAKGVIYTVDRLGHVVASNVSDGHPLWATNLNAPISAGTAAGDALVAVASRKGFLYVLDAKTGKLQWQSAVSDTVLATPVVAQGKVFVKTIDGNLYVFNEKTGKQQWLYEHGSPGLMFGGSSSPAVSGNSVIAGFANGHVMAIGLNSAKVMWNKAIAVPSGITAVQKLVDVDDTPVIQNSSVYAASYQGNIAALNLSTGKIFWQHKISSYSGLALGIHQVFISDANGVIWAFDSLSGGINWRQFNLQNTQLTAPVVMKNAVVVANDEGYIYWLNKTDGAIEASVRMSLAGINSPPVVVKNTVIALNERGELRAYVSNKTTKIPT